LIANWKTKHSAPNNSKHSLREVLVVSYSRGEMHNILGNFHPWRRDHYVATRRREKNTHWRYAKS